MHPALPGSLPLICPRCRTTSERGRELFTLSTRTILREEKGEILDGELGCDNTSCNARYPIVDGIPIVVADVAAVLQGQGAAILSDRDPRALAALGKHGPDEAQLPRLLEHLSIYVDAHFGDQSTPPPSPVPFGFAGFAGKLSGLEARVRQAVELGCSAGRGLLELSRTAEFVLGIDLHFGALRAARRILGGEPYVHLRRISGRHYATAEVRIAAPPVNIALVCGDVLDPPLVPQTFGRAVALNVIDSVRRPAQLLSVLDGVLAPGGELIASSPYAWQSDIVEEAARPPDDNGAQWLRSTLKAGRGLESAYSIVEDTDVEWNLRRDERAGHFYRSHYLRARKAESGKEPQG